MDIKQVPIDDLQPASYNPRKLTEDQHRHLKESISKFGMVDPLIVNSHPGRENIVVGGHMRLLIAKELGLTQVPVYYVNLDEAGERELNLRLNKNGGEFDFEMMANQFDTELLNGIGFTNEDLGLAERAKAGKTRISIRVDSEKAEDVITKIRASLEGVDYELRIRKV